MLGEEYKTLSMADKKKVEYLLNNFCGGFVNPTVLGHIYGTLDMILAEHLNEQLKYLRKKDLIKVCGK